MCEEESIKLHRAVADVKHSDENAGTSCTPDRSTGENAKSTTVFARCVLCAYVRRIKPPRRTLTASSSLPSGLEQKRRAVSDADVSHKSLSTDSDVTHFRQECRHLAHCV